MEPHKKLPTGITSVRLTEAELRTNAVRAHEKKLALIASGYDISEILPIPEIAPASPGTSPDFGGPLGQEFGNIAAGFKSFHERFGFFPVGKSPEICKILKGNHKTNNCSGWPHYLWASNGAMLDTWRNALDVTTTADGKIEIRSRGPNGDWGNEDDLMLRTHWYLEAGHWHSKNW